MIQVHELVHICEVERASGVSGLLSREGAAIDVLKSAEPVGEYSPDPQG
jgi:hypothetical protein